MLEENIFLTTFNKFHVLRDVDVAVDILFSITTSRVKRKPFHRSEIQMFFYFISEDHTCAQY